MVDVDVEGGEACVAGIKKNGGISSFSFPLLISNIFSLLSSDICNEGEAVFMKVDISNEDECRLLAENTVAKYGRIDCLVNNAAVYPTCKSFFLHFIYFTYFIIDQV